MENRDFKEFTVQALVNKMKKLRQKYKQEKDKSNKSGTGKRKKWKYFERMDRVLCDKALVKPPLVIDTSNISDLYGSGGREEIVDPTGNYNV